MITIPLSKPYIGEAEKTAVMEVLDSGILAQGPRTAKLEACFAQLCGVTQAIATSSGTTALHLALLANDIGPGDEVITTPFTFIASANSILFTGARPIFVDVEAETFNLNPRLVEAAITPRTKAILAVHLYGQMCHMEALQGIARKHGLRIIEDACQAVGATYQGKASGSFGTGVFSLYATKNIMSGEGGMITTNDEEIAERCRLLRNHGMQRRYYHEQLGYNFRLSDLHAAIGLAQMDRLAEFTTRRQTNANYLNAHLKSVITPKAQDGYGHVWHQYTVRLNGQRDRETAIKRLTEAGIGVGIFYPVPVHQQNYIYEMLGVTHQPVAEQLAQEVISLPVHPQLSQADLEKIVFEVNCL